MGMLLGTYLSKPVTTKHSNDEEDNRMVYGVSSMQGWRETQEDAHNCILDYDPGVSYFAVYDGHGGAEVSEYTAQKLPDFLKLNRHYIRGDYEAALKDAFVKFDCTLKKRKVVKYLHKLARETRRWSREKDETEEENLRSLKAEALMPLEEVLAKYALKRMKIKNKKRSKGSKSSKARETDENACPSSSKETVSEVSSDAPECSSSKSNTVSLSESDSEVTSSSSVCALLKKSLSEKCNNNGDVDKTLLDSTSNGSEGGSSNSGGSSQNVSEGVTLSSQLNVSEGDAQPESSKAGESGKPADSATCSTSVENKDMDVKCNGESIDIQSDDVISSSVENGEVEVSKSSGKGKSLVKPKPKKTGEEKESESSEVLFHKFLHSEVNEDSSESDSDDATFTGPDIKSDDDDDDDDEDDEEDDEEEEEEEEEGEADEEEDEDEEDEEREEDEEKEEEEEKGEVGDEKEDDEENKSGDAVKFEGHADESEAEDEDEDKENDSERTLLAPGSDSGCTALVALIKNDKLYVANAGDCRCVVSKNGEAVELSLDHKPENEIELRRIEKAGGRVHGGRVNDGLNLSRAIGDHVYKQTPGLPPEEQMISPLPDIQTLDLDPNIEFMVLACDGIWNSMSSQEVVDFVRPRLQNRTEVVSKICEQLFDHCLAPDTLCDGTGCDNMTAIIIQFKNSKFFTSKKRPIEENEAEEAPKKQKTADATSDDSIDSSSQPSESFLEKPSNSPDTTQ